MPSHEWYITASIDEAKVLADVRKQSLTEGEVLVHWHSATHTCRGHKHATYKNGEAQEDNRGEVPSWLA